MTIKIEINLADDFFADILCTAVEDGIHGWARTRNPEIDSSTGAMEYLSCEVCPDWSEGKPYEEGNPLNDWQKLDYARLEAALQKIVALETNVGDHIYNPVVDAIIAGDASVIDADAADAIIQVALIGEIVFG